MMHATAFCSMHPVVWRRPVSRGGPSLLLGGELADHHGYIRSITRRSGRREDMISQPDRPPRSRKKEMPAWLSAKSHPASPTTC
jgi:hypothetical protein